MSDGGRRMRARDADREQVISVLDTAYVEGQLTAEDRERRVSRALAAQTVGDLHGLVGDLQQDLPAPVEEVRQPRRRWIAAAAAALVVVVGAGLAFSQGGEEPADPPAVALPEVDPLPEPPMVEEPEVPEPVVEEDPEPTHEPLTLPAFREFVRAYRAEFDTTVIYDAAFHEDGRVFFDATHGDPSRDRLQDWSWSPVDGFRSYSEPTTNVFGYAPVDLRQVRFKAVAENVEHALRYLNVEDPNDVTVRLEHRTIHEEPPRVRFHVSNQYRESAHMTTTLKGRMLQSHPFSPTGL